MVTFVSQCEKNALKKTRRVLDAFATRDHLDFAGKRAADRVLWPWYRLRRAQCNTGLWFIHGLALRKKAKTQNELKL